MLDKLLPVGITTYTEVSVRHAKRDLEHMDYVRYASASAHASHQLQPCVQFFTEAELQGLEAAADGLHAKAGTQLPPTAFHQTHALGGSLRRTKMFFGARCEPPVSP